MGFELNKDTYITVDDAFQILIYGDFLSSDSNRREGWIVLDHWDKQTCLKQAALAIDSLKFVGIKLEEDQKMAFPRKYIMHEDDEVPENVKNAQALEALELAFPTNDSTMADSYAGNVRSYSLGSISESLKSVDAFSVKAVIKSVKAQRLLLPYLGGGYRVR